MARRLDHRRGHQQLGERLQRLHQQEGQGETTSVETPEGRPDHPDIELSRGNRGRDSNLRQYIVSLARVADIDSRT